MPARLKLHITRKIDESYTVTDGMTLGRSDRADVVLLDSAISRIHARVEQRAGRFWIVDSGSSNGILVNGAKADAHALIEGDLVQIGNKKLVFTEAEPLPAAPAHTVDLTKRPLASYPMEQIIAAEDVLLMIPTIQPLMEMIYEIVAQLIIKSPLKGEPERDFITAVQEAVRNAATHGNKWSPGKTLTLRYARDNEKVVALIADQGTGFDYKQVLHESRRIGRKTLAREEFLKSATKGRGLVRMLAAVDAVEFNDKGNEVILTKFLERRGTGETKWRGEDMPTRRDARAQGDGPTMRRERAPQPIDPGDVDLDKLITDATGDHDWIDEPDELEL